MASTMKKHFNRLNQALSQSIGRSEKSEVISEDLQNIDQRVEIFVNILKHTRKKLVDCSRSKKTASTKEEAEKRKLAFEEYKLAQAMIAEAKNIDAMYNGNLLSDVMLSYGDTLSALVQDMVKCEMQIEQNVVEKWSKFVEDFDSISQQKDKLKKLGLDMDSAKSKLNTAQNRGDDRVNEMQDEFDSAYGKVESFKDAFATDLYTLASKEVEMAGTFKTLLQIQIEYHRNALRRFEALEPIISKKIDSYPRRPVYGCPLDVHLQHSGREIALVLEACCGGLVDLGLRDEGIFRIPGNATKVRKLKAAFDAGENDFGDAGRDPHALAGALKLYLRELPDSLMTSALYSDWMSAAKIPDDQTRLLFVREIIAKLPPANYANLRYLIKFLSKLLENEAYTKMSSQNLAIVMAPNMIWSPLNEEGYSLNSAHGLLVELLLVNADVLFPGEIHFQSPLFSNGSNYLENGQVARQDALFVDVSFGGNSAVFDDSLSTEKQISPTKGSSKKSKPAPPPPGGTAGLSPILRDTDQRPSRSSLRGVPFDRFSSGKMIDLQADAGGVPLQSTELRSSLVIGGGHKKSNSWDRHSGPQWSLAPDINQSNDKTDTAPVEQQLSTSTSELGYSSIPRGSPTSHSTKSATFPRPQQQQQLQQQRVRPPVPARSSILQKPTSLGLDEVALVGTMVEVMPSDESDVEEPVIEEASFGLNSGQIIKGPTTNESLKVKQQQQQLPSTVLAELEQKQVAFRYPTTPKEVSYVAVLEEADALEQQADTQPQQLSSRPKPPIPTKPRSVESPDKESIVRL